MEHLTTEQLQQRAREAKKCTWIGFAVNGALALLKIIAGIIGLTLTMWVIIAMRTTPDNDDDDDTFDNSDVITRDAHTDTTTIER